MNENKMRKQIKFPPTWIHRGSRMVPNVLFFILDNW